MRLFAAGAMALASTGAQAVTLGDTVTCSPVLRLVCSASQATVGNGVEFTLGTSTRLGYVPNMSFNFSQDMLQILIPATSISDGQTYFYTSDLTNPITNATLLSATGTSNQTFTGPGFTQDNLAVIDNQLRINLAGVIYTNAVINISLAPAAVAGVPEPASWAMMIAGFGAVGFALRKAKALSDARFEEKIKRLAAGENA